MTTNQNKFEQTQDAPLSVQTPVPKNTTIAKQVSGMSTDECIKIRKNRMYKGQLSYIKNILLKDNPELTDSILSERLDVSKSVAKLLLHDCQNDCSE